MLLAPSHLSLPLLLGFADAILGEGRPLAFSEETEETLGRCSMGFVVVVCLFVFSRMGKE